MTDPNQALALAVLLTGHPPDGILACRLRPDGSLAVVVQPGPKLIFTPAEVQAARQALAGAKSGLQSGGEVARVQAQAESPHHPAQPARAAPRGRPARGERTQERPPAGSVRKERKAR